MIRKADILRMVSHVHRQNRGLPPRRLIHPAREWGVGVVVAVLVVVASAAYGVYLYRTIDSLSSSITPSPVTTVRYDTTAVERALEQYADRAAQTDSLLRTAPVVPVVPVSPATSTSTSTASTTVEIEQPPVPESTEAPELAS